MNYIPCKNINNNGYYFNIYPKISRKRLREKLKAKSESRKFTEDSHVRKCKKKTSFLLHFARLIVSLHQNN